MQQLTELGVDRIRPVRARRSVVRWDAVRADAAVARLRRVAREAADAVPARPRSRGRRPRRPLRRCPAAPAWSWATRRVSPPTAVAAPAGDGWLVVVGPEGGLEADEIEQLGPLERVAVGPHVLRAETAAVAVAAALTVRRQITHAE